MASTPSPSEGRVKEDRMLYFAYGSNMDNEQVKRRCGSASFVCRATLRDHVLDFPRWSDGRQCGVADVTAGPGHSVWGVVYDIEDREIPDLDKCEGYFGKNDPRNSYDQREATVFRDGVLGQPQDITLYRAVRQGPVKPSTDYLGHIIKGARLWSLPAEYILELEAIETAP